MAIENAEEVIVELKDKVRKATNAVEASQWARCLQSFVTANAIHDNLKFKSD